MFPEARALSPQRRQEEAGRYSVTLSSSICGGLDGAWPDRAQAPPAQIALRLCRPTLVAACPFDP